MKTNKASRPRLLRIGEIETTIDRERALPDLPRGHAARPPPANLAERHQRFLIEPGKLCARRDGSVRTVAPRPAAPRPAAPRTAACRATARAVAVLGALRGWA